MLEGLALATAGFAQEPLLLVAAYFCTGCANSAMVLVGATHRSLAVPQDFRVRMAAANIMASQVAGAIGLALGGWALLHWTVAEVYGAFGLTASVLALSFLCIPRANEFFGLDHPAVVDWYRLQYPLAFSAATEQQPKPT